MPTVLMVILCFEQVTMHLCMLVGSSTAFQHDGAAGLASTSQAAEVPPDLYVPGPVTVGPEIWAGVIASCIPFAIGSWEFAKRIVGLTHVLYAGGCVPPLCWCCFAMNSWLISS